jgi:nucleotide-binding universal stress UspA family protein
MKKILVPTDFSSFSDHACDYALKLAESLNAELKLFHSFLDPVLGSPVPLYDFGGYEKTHKEIVKLNEEQVEEEMEKLYRKLNECAEKEGMERISMKSYQIENGFPDEEILNFCKLYQPDLVVMGTKGSGGVIKDLFGSVTEKVLENAEVPVLAIPETPYGGVIERIMYATDFDDSDNIAIDKLMRIVEPLGVKLYIAHVCFGEMFDKEKEQMKAIEKYVIEKYPMVESHFNIIECENILQAFDDFVEENLIDIISLTTHKRNIFKKILNPSFAKKMLFHTKAPLLVFHSK